MLALATSQNICAEINFCAEALVSQEPQLPYRTPVVIAASGVMGMTELETRVTEMGAGLKLLTGMLGLTVALLPDADRAIVLKALAALQTESGPEENTDKSRVAARSEVEAGKALTVLIERFAVELAAARVASTAR